MRMRISSSHRVGRGGGGIWDVCLCGGVMQRILIISTVIQIVCTIFMLVHVLLHMTALDRSVVRILRS